MEHSGSVYALAHHAELNLLWTGGADKVVASWDLNNFSNTPFSIKTKSAILNLNVIDKNHLFIGLFNGDFHIVNLISKKEIKHFTFHKKGVFASSFSEQHARLVVGSGDGCLSIWDTSTYTLLHSEKISEGKIRAIEIVNSIAYVGTSEGYVLQVDVNSVKLLNSYKISEEGINTICFYAQKNALLIGGKKASLFVFSLSKLEVILEFPAHNWPIYKILNLADSGIYSCSRDKTIKKWNVENLEVEKRYCFPEFKAHTHSINNLIHIPEKKLLISAGDDKSFCIWKLDISA